MAEKVLNILLVDDDEGFLHSLSRLLGGVGPLRVDATTDPLEAMLKLRANGFDVCFLDFRLAEAAGENILRMVSEPEMRTAFIFMTAHACKGDAFAALRLGAMDYVVKDGLQPFHLVKTLAFSLFHKSKELELSATAMRDNLTGLGNRALFREQAARLVAQARRARQHVGLLFMDIDGLKAVNDTYGHQVGDQLLRQVANRILHHTRESDIIARLGGDEFVAVLPQVGDGISVQRVARKLAAAIGQIPFQVDSLTLRVGISCGTAIFPTDADDVDELMRLADKRMYKQKSARKTLAHKAMVWFPGDA